MRIISGTTAVANTKIDTRFENFTSAYEAIGYDREDSELLGAERLEQDDNALFTVPACTDYRTAKETVWLLEAVSELCSGELGNNGAIQLINKALVGLTGK